MSLADWDLLIRQARRSVVLARLCERADLAGVLARLPEAPRLHLEAARTLARKHARDIHWEVRCIARALRDTDVPLILLKGAAYVMAGLPAARGRIFSDVDILVPWDSLAAVEAALEKAGWRQIKLDAYDQRYYRNWMHQIPPLRHAERGSVIDVHHTIVPRTTRVRLDAAELRAAARPLSDHPGIWTLAPADLVLHSATHLFNEGEAERSLRDLDDLDLLLRHFAAAPGFWEQLVARARELDLARQLYYALRHTARLLGTPVPAATLQLAQAGAPHRLLRPIMDTLFDRMLRASHPSCHDALSATALWLLYARAHHLRLPPHLLIPHLIHKAIARRLERFKRDEDAAAAAG
ncbi:MAG: nucleotidyltransferase family protein [Proteobacteria bacterium]|nr:nucleotidyltransferase family protein [Pseudomonadota bacterium]